MHERADWGLVFQVPLSDSLSLCRLSSEPWFNRSYRKGKTVVCLSRKDVGLDPNIRCFPPFAFLSPASRRENPEEAV